jgi:hypothetical protein
MTLEEIVAQKIEEIDVNEMVSAIIKNLISDNVKREIDRQVKEKVSNLITVEFDIQMKKPIVTNDGWGKKETYASFEELFKKHFRASMDSTWEVQKTIERLVKERVDTMVREYSKQICEKAANEIIAAVKTKEPKTGVV